MKYMTYISAKKYKNYEIMSLILKKYNLNDCYLGLIYTLLFFF